MKLIWKLGLTIYLRIYFLSINVFSHHIHRSVISNNNTISPIVLITACIEHLPQYVSSIG